MTEDQQPSQQARRGINTFERDMLWFFKRAAVVYGVGMTLLVVGFVFFPPPPAKTYTHDGHLWIESTSGKYRSPTHHPDCPCLKPQP